MPHPKPYRVWIGKCINAVRKQADFRKPPECSRHGGGGGSLQANGGDDPAAPSLPHYTTRIGQVTELSHRAIETHETILPRRRRQARRLFYLAGRP
jgi:hypothetical protein